VLGLIVGIRVEATVSSSSPHVSMVS